MIKVLFVCYGNICRSPMAEFIMKSKCSNLPSDIRVDSKATSSEELGNPVYYAIRPYLDNLKVNYSKKRAEKITAGDGDFYDYIIVMETYNADAVKRIIDRKNHYKVKRLLDYTDKPADIDDPWYTRDFDACYNEINYGIDCFIEYLKKNL